MSEIIYSHCVRDK